MILFQQIRNATVKLQYSSATFMIDPWLMDACLPKERDQAVVEQRFIPKPICPLPASAEELISGVDFYLLTHFHPDHFSLDYLPADAAFICQNEHDAGQLQKMGVSNVCWFHEESLQIGGVTIYRVDARHGESDELAAWTGSTSGFVFVCTGEKTVYLAGDTVYYEGVQSVIDRFQPEVIIVNACDARRENNRLIMNTEDVKKTCDCKPDSMLIASHMDTVSHAHLSRKQLKLNLTGTRYAEQVRIPEDGECIEISNRDLLLHRNVEREAERCC